MIPEAAQDALRDALALIRADAAGDAEAIRIVSAHLTDPGATAAMLAHMLTVHMDAYGDRLTWLDGWQRAAGL